MRVKIDPQCHINHRPPHRPWYLLDDWSGVQPEFIHPIWNVEDYQDDKNYIVVSVEFSDREVRLLDVPGSKINYLIQKRDAIEV